VFLGEKVLTVKSRMGGKLGLKNNTKQRSIKRESGKGTDEDQDRKKPKKRKKKREIVKLW